MNKAVRTLENMAFEEKNFMVESVGEISKDADVEEQARYVNELLNCAAERDIPMQEVMRKCGRSCLTADVIEPAKNIYERASDEEEFLAGLNQEGIGGGNLHIENGKVIAVYKECYCDLPYKVKQINPVYCQCSAGWFQALFSEVLGKKVHVKLINTIVDGAKECIFEIDCFNEISENSPTSTGGAMNHQKQN